MTWQDPNWSTVVEWNAALENREEREPQPRDYLWASELGKAPIDVILRMKGVKETNPPNGRSKRKFEAGNYMEWLVSLVYFRAGILKTQQQRIEHQYDGMLRVSGKADFLVGGIPDYTDWERTEALMRELQIPEFIFRTANEIRESLAKKYPEGLKEKFIETKSCSGMMFDAMEKKGWVGQVGHRKQLFFYLKGANYPNGDIVYVDKDSLRMAEVRVQNPGPVEDEYRETVEELTHYYNSSKDIPVEEIIEIKVEEGIEYPTFHWKEGLPQPEPLIVFSKDMGKFSKNFNVEYSGYLSMLYGFEQPSEYAELFKPLIGRWNRVLARLKVGQNRNTWLLEQGLGEQDVQSEMVVIEGKKNRKKIQFVEFGGQKILVPDEIAKGYEITPKNIEVLDEIKGKGFNIDEILADFAGVEEEEGETEE